MNFLAHAHLSGKNEEVLFGNFVADSIKGRQLLDYSPEIVQGVNLHRKIDRFTDKHFIVRRSIASVKPDLGRYSGVAVDIFYDHFLAANWQQYAQDDLVDFSLHVYRILAKRFLILPARNKRILPFMMAQNWLVSYSNFYDLERVFRGMDRRTGYKSQLGKSVAVLKNNYHALEQDFSLFYPELQKFAADELRFISE